MKKRNTYINELKEDRTFKHLFQILHNHDDAVYYEYYEKGEIVSCTYREFAALARSTAYTLHTVLKDISKGSFIGLHFDNCPDWILVFWGLIMSGYNPVLLDFRAAPENLDHLIKESGIGAIITDTAQSDAIPVIDRKNVMSCLQSSPSDWEVEWGTSLAYCTSGTTESSRIYVYDQHAVATNIYNTLETFEKSSFLMYDDSGTIRVLAFLPFYHIYGFIAIYCLYSVCGSTFVYIPDRTPETIQNTCQKMKITHIHSVPLLWSNIAKKIIMSVDESSFIKKIIFTIMINLSLGVQKLLPEAGRKFAFNFLFKGLHQKLLGTAVRCLAYGGASLTPVNMRLMSAFGFPLVGGYGMTEAGIICAETGENRKRRMSGCSGKPCLEVKVVRPDKSEAATGFGELYVRGDMIHTARLREGRLIGPFVDQDGWFASGDIVTISKNGYLFCKGRSKDTIVSASGENVYPDEIENFFENIPGISELTVIGLKDKKYSENVVLVFHPLTDWNNKKGLSTITKKIHEINNHLPSYKKVREILISHNPLPLTTSMKTQRQKLITAIEKRKWKLYSLDLENV